MGQRASTCLRDSEKCAYECVGCSVVRIKQDDDEEIVYVTKQTVDLEVVGPAAQAFLERRGIPREFARRGHAGRGPTLTTQLIMKREEQDVPETPSASLGSYHVTMGRNLGGKVTLSPSFYANARGAEASGYPDPIICVYVVSRKQAEAEGGAAASGSRRYFYDEGEQEQQQTGSGSGEAVARSYHNNKKKCLIILNEYGGARVFEEEDDEEEVAFEDNVYFARSLEEAMHCAENFVIRRHLEVGGFRFCMC